MQFMKCKNFFSTVFIEVFQPTVPFVLGTFPRRKKTLLCGTNLSVAAQRIQLMPLIQNELIYGGN